MMVIINNIGVNLDNVNTMYESVYYKTGLYGLTEEKPNNLHKDQMEKVKVVVVLFKNKQKFITEWNLSVAELLTANNIPVG